MKLYIWDDPYPVRYGSSLLFAVAESLDEAKKQALTGIAYAYGEFRQEWQPNADMVKKLGDPIRILHLPCAEWHEWSE